MLGDLFQHIEDLSNSNWFYLFIFVIVFLDSMIPIVPSETLVILGGVAAGQGDLVLPLVILCGAAGAFAGDSCAYLIGRRWGPWVEHKFFSKPKGQKRLAWADHQLETRGGSLLLTARFIPGGRTVVTFSSGVTRQPFHRFALFVLIAATAWAVYATMLGFLGGKAFADNHFVAFVVAFGCVLGVSAVLEVVRRARERRKAPEEHTSGAPT